MVMLKKGLRFSSGLISIVAAATSTQAWPTQAGRTAVVKKLHAFNRTGGNVQLTIGWVDAAGTFHQVLRYTLLNGFDLELGEDVIPIVGNTPDGFTVDNSGNVALNSDGFIYVQSTAAAAAPANVEVTLEVAEFLGGDSE